MAAAKKPLNIHLLNMKRCCDLLLYVDYLPCVKSMDIGQDLLWRVYGLQLLVSPHNRKKKHEGQYPAISHKQA